MSKYVALSALVLVAACSGGGGGSVPTPSPTPGPTPTPPMNMAPSVSVSNTSIVYEGITKNVARITASDPEGQSIIHSLAGDDAAFFELIFDDIGPYVSVIERLDFENPIDTNADNIYNVEVRVSDGTDTSSSNLEITVTDIEKDGIVRITDGKAVIGTPDLTGDGVADLVMTSDAPGEWTNGSELVGAIVSRAAITSEEQLAISLADLYTGGTGGVGARAIIVDDDNIPFQRLSFRSGFAPSMSDPIPYLSMSGSEFEQPSLNNDTATIFTDTYSNVLVDAGELDLNSILPMGIRTTKDQAMSGVQAFLPVGDLNGDGVSEIREDVFNLENFGETIAGVEIETSFSFFDGTDIRSGGSGNMFADVLDADTEARLLLFPRLEYIANQILLLPNAKREIGEIDVTGDGVDDFIVNLGLRGSIPVEAGLVNPDGYVIEIISGAALMAETPGPILITSMAAPNRLRIKVPSDFAQPFLADVADFNGDDFADIVLLARNNNDPGSRGRAYEVFIISGAALANDPEGVVDLADFPGPAGTVINTVTPLHTLTQDAFSVGDMIGGTTNDLILTYTRPHRDDPTNRPVAFILSGDLFEDGFPEVLDISDSETQSLNDKLQELPAGSAVRINGAFVSFHEYITGFAFANAGTDIGDGDGDNHPDLALTHVLEDIDTNEEKTEVFIIPSGIIRAASLAGEAVEIDTMIDFGSE